MTQSRPDQASGETERTERTGPYPAKARHPHAGLIGQPEADTVMFAAGPATARRALVRLDRGKVDRAEGTLPFSVVTLLESQLRPPQASRRRRIVSRCVLAAILCCQAAMSLRLRNTAFQDEAQYLYAGHLMLEHWLHGAAEQGTYGSYFTGSPAIYPPVAALLSQLGGLAAARALSTVEMACVTALLYSMTRLMFNERAGLCAAALFAVTEPTILMGHLATVDAMSLLWLAVASWGVVRCAAVPGRLYLIWVIPAALAVATSYPALIFLPAVAALAGLCAMPYLDRAGLGRAFTFGGAAIGLAAVTAALAGQTYLTAARAALWTYGTTSAATILGDAGRWAGVIAALAVLGAVAYARQASTEKAEVIAPPGGPLRRGWLGGCLAGTLLLVTCYELLQGSDAQLDRIIGFGIFFAAPMAGIGLVRLVGDHFRRPQLGIAAWAFALTLGLGQAGQLFASWPDSAPLVSQLARYVGPGDRYLVEDDDVPMYYLSTEPDAQPDQFTSTYYFAFTPPGGQQLTGTPAYLAAVRAGYFKVIAYNFSFTPQLDKALAAALELSSKYRLAAVVPESAAYAHDTAYVWVRI
jgi:4-amino-4-deoxy-L-arabinose transferase-like glycosyltransferase